MPELTHRETLRLRRKELAQAALSRAREREGRVERAVPMDRQRASSTKQFDPDIGSTVASTGGDNSTRIEYPDKEPYTVRKAKASTPARTQQKVYSPPVPRNAFGTPKDPNAEPIRMGGGKIPFSNTGPSNGPTNYRLHVLTALSLAVLIRIARYGTKALTG